MLKKIIDSFKRDILTIIGLFEEPEKYRFDLSRIAKPQYFVLFMIVCFLCGAYVSAKYYESKTNEILTKQCKGYTSIQGISSATSNDSDTRYKLILPQGLEAG